MTHKNVVTLLIAVGILIIAGIGSLVLVLQPIGGGGCTMRPQVFFTLDWHPNGKMIAAGGTSGLFLYSNTLENVTAKKGLNFTSGILSVGWSPDGNLLAASFNTNPENGAVQLWDAQTFKPVGKLTNNYDNDSFGRLTWSPNSNQIAVPVGKRVSIWSALQFNLVSDLFGHTNFVESVSWSPDGTQLASSGLDGVIKVWDVSTRRQIFSMDDSEDAFTVLLVKWNPVNNLIVSSSTGGNIKIWDSQTGTLLHTFDPKSKLWLTSLAWSHDGKRIAIADDSVQIWDIDTGQMTQQLIGSDQIVETVAWSPDDTELVSGGDDGMIRVWDIASRKILYSEHTPGEPFPRCTY